MKLLKIIIPIIFLFLFEGSALAQDLILKSGLNLSYLQLNSNNTSQVVGPRTGLHLAFLTDFQLSKKIYLETGLMVQMKGGQETRREIFLGRRYEYKKALDIYELGLPLMFGFQLPIKKSRLFAHAGPALGINFYGYNKETTTIDGEIKESKNTINFGSGISDLKLLDLSIISGLGYEWNKILISFQYQLGISDWNNGDFGTSTKTRILSVSLGYFFR